MTELQSRDSPLPISSKDDCMIDSSCKYSLGQESFRSSKSEVTRGSKVRQRLAPCEAGLVMVGISMRLWDRR